MTCITCGHTMQHLNCAEPLFWCPRYGTVTSGASLHATYAPQLVERCRLFLHGAAGREDGIGELPSEEYKTALAIATRLGITEAINILENKP